jgi:hypothetical protein
MSAGGVLTGKDFSRQFVEILAQATLSGDEEKFLKIFRLHVYLRFVRVS